MLWNQRMGEIVRYFILLLCLTMLGFMPVKAEASNALYETFLQSREVLATIYFPMNSAVLDKDRHDQISKVMSQVRKLQTDGHLIRVEGYSSPEGDVTENMVLSMYRARTIAEIISAKGCEAEIAMTGYGDLLSQSNDPAKERRVEIASYQQPVTLKRIRIAEDRDRPTSMPYSKPVVKESRAPYRKPVALKLPLPVPHDNQIPVAKIIEIDAPFGRPIVKDADLYDSKPVAQDADIYDSKPVAQDADIYDSKPVAQDADIYDSKPVAQDADIYDSKPVAQDADIYDSKPVAQDADIYDSKPVAQDADIYDSKPVAQDADIYDSKPVAQDADIYDSKPVAQDADIYDSKPVAQDADIYDSKPVAQDADIYDSKPVAQDADIYDSKPVAQDADIYDSKPVAQDADIYDAKPVAQEASPTAPDNKPIAQQARPLPLPEVASVYYDEPVIDALAIEQAIMEKMGRLPAKPAGALSQLDQDYFGR
ncbi:MAG: OmpA family protein [Desulfuromonadales bacterium]|nr:OmpA family protein [Desulfuromonadales bacterium]